MSDETRYLGPTGGSDGDRPRQYFPGEDDPAYQAPQAPQYGQYGQYQQPYQAAPEGASRSRGAMPMVLGVLFGLTLLAAGLFFFLWRNAEAELAKPVEPVTVTQTTSLTVTETTTALPALPTELPTELPSELPEIDIEGWLNDLLGQP